MQDANDPFPAYPEDADVPEGSSLISFRTEAAEKVRELGNAHFRQVCRMAQRAAAVFSRHQLHLLADYTAL